jgi:hypothetical protein
MRKHMTQVVAIPFQQEPWKYDDRLMQLATEGTLRFVADQEGRQHFGREPSSVYTEDFACFFGSHRLATA